MSYVVFSVDDLNCNNQNGNYTIGLSEESLFRNY